MIEATIHDQLYLLALVYINDTERLKVLLDSKIISFDINFSYSIPVPSDANTMDLINDLLLISGFFTDLNDFMVQNRLFQILFAQNNIDQLKPNPEIEAILNQSQYYSNCFDYYPIQLTEDVTLLNEASDTFEMTLLKVAVLMEYDEMVKCLINYGALVEPQTKNIDIHPIHLSLYQNSTLILRVLLDQLSLEYIGKKSINDLIDKNGLNPLHLAIYNQSIECINLLYDFGADINHLTESVRYPLIWAMETFEISDELIEHLLQLKADPNVVDNFNGISPLIVAIVSDKHELVNLLIKYGADVNQKFDESYTNPLKIAIDYYLENQNGEAILKSLLEAGACVNFKLSEIIQSSESMDNQDSAHNENDDFDVIMNRVQLLTQTNELNSNRSYRRYPFILAIYSGCMSLIKLLLEYGAYPHTIELDYYSPMCSACSLGNKEAVNLLLSYNVDPTTSCHQTNTPLTISVSKNDSQLVRTLMSYYKNKECINKQDINGDFALLYAVYNKNTPIIKELLDSGANANLINKHNVYPLWYAVYNNDKSSFFQLIKYCIDFETKSYGIDYQNFETIPEIIYDRPISPIALAEFKCFYDIVYYLYCVGAKVTIDLRRRIKTKLNSLNEPSTVVSANDINKLKRLDKLLNQPMKLTRICRISIRNKNKNHLNRLECVNVVPSSIKEFLTLETF